LSPRQNPKKTKGSERGWTNVDVDEDVTLSLVNDVIVEDLRESGGDDAREGNVKSREGQLLKTPRDTRKRGGREQRARGT
jgi:hypothetical protein